jgi:hypothetical protein
MKIIERTHDVLTGKITDLERDETKEETKSRLDAEKGAAEAAAIAAQKATDKAALLAQLGITEEQAKLLLG